MFWFREHRGIATPTMRLLALVLALTCVTHVSSQQSQGCTSTTDVIFVLDSSGSLNENSARAGNWNAIKTFVSTAIRNLGDTIERRYPRSSQGIRVALVQFAETAFLTFGLNQYRNYNDAAAAVLSAQNFRGSTNMAAGLNIAESLLPPQSSFNRRNTIIVVVSDFQPNVDRNELFIAQRIKNRNDVKIVSAGVRGMVDEVLLRQIASENRVVFAEDYRAFLNFISPLLMVMCESPPLQPAASCSRDIILVLDASISIQTWDRLKEFAALVAANLANADRNTRIGVVSFSDSATVIAPVQPYSTFLASLIRNAAHNRQFTNIASGLQATRTMFTDPNRQRHVIVFTDGVATTNAGSEVFAAEDLRRNYRVNVIAYGVGPTIDRGTLERMVANNLRGTNVIVNPQYSTSMISQINSVTTLTNCASSPALPCIEQEADVVLVLDASGSIVDKGSSNWQRMQDFGAELVRQLQQRRPPVRIGAVSFSTQATWLSPVTNDYFRVAQAIRTARHLGSFTNQAAALRMARDLLNTAAPVPGGPRAKYVIMVTDGEPTREQGLEITEAQRMTQEGITRILVGVTNSINRNNLYSIASRPDTVIYSENFETLNSVPMVTAVLRQTANCPPSVGTPSRDFPQIPQTPLFPPPTPPPTTRCYAADVIFAMDRSGSIEAERNGNFQRLKNFVSDLARSLHQRYNQVRFGLIGFSDQANIISFLERYSNVETFVNIIQSVTYIGSRTNLAAAIRESRRALERQATRLPQIILVTDGEATEETGREYTEANIARSFGIRLSAIAVTNMIQEDALIRLTGSRNQVFRAPNFQSIRNEIVSVVEVACLPQGDTAVSCTGLPEIVFALDSSASITPDEARMAKEFIMNSIDTFKRGNANSRFGMVIFSTFARPIFGLSGDLNYIRGQVNSVQNENGRTNIAEGLERAASVLASARPGSNRIIILITDGLANERIGQEIGVANNIKNTGISIVPVGVTEYGPDYSTLQAISSSRNGNGVVRSLNFAMLSQRIGELTQIVCRPNQNVFIPAREPPPRLPPPQEIICPGTHIVLLVDKSRRLNPTQSDLDRTKNLLADLVRYVSSTRPATKFAIVTFDSIGKVEDSFSPSRTINEILLIIQSIRLGNTADSYSSNIARGLFSARNTISQRVNTRSTKTNIILFSDGVSTLDSSIVLTEAAIVRSMGIEIMAVAIPVPGVRPQVGSLQSITGEFGRVFETGNRRMDPSRITNIINNCGSINGLAFLRQGDYKCPEEIIFVVDSGGNQTMNKNNRTHVTNFMTTIVEQYARFYDVRGRFAAVQYNDMAEVALTFSKDLPLVTYTLSHFNPLNYTEGTPANLAKGLQRAKELFEENSKKKLVIVITDETAEVDATQEILNEVSELEDKDIGFLVVGVASSPEDDVFYELIAGSDGFVVSVDRYEELKNEISTVIDNACKEKTVDITFRQNADDQFMLQSASDKIILKPAKDDLISLNPVANGQLNPNPVADNPVAENPVADGQVNPNPVGENPVADNPVAENPVAANPVAANPVADGHVNPNPVADNPVAANPVADEQVNPDAVTESQADPNPPADGQLNPSPVPAEST